MPHLSHSFYSLHRSSRLCLIITFVLFPAQKLTSMPHYNISIYSLYRRSRKCLIFNIPFIPLHRSSRGQQAQQVQLRVPDVQPGAEVPALPGVPREEPRRGAPAPLHHLRQAVRHPDQAAHARQHPLRPEALPGQAQHSNLQCWRVKKIIFKSSLEG